MNITKTSDIGAAQSEIGPLQLQYVNPSSDWTAPISLSSIANQTMHVGFVCLFVVNIYIGLVYIFILACNP